MNRRKFGASSEDFHNECKAAYLSIYDSTIDKITSSRDLSTVLQQTGRNPSTKMLNKYWKMETRSISYSEFVSICREIPVTSQDDLMKAFRKMDSNGDGYVSKQEFMRAMTTRGERMTMEEVTNVIDLVDTNRDGRLDYKEFCQLILSNIEDCKRMSKQKMAKKDNDRAGAQRGDRKSNAGVKNGKALTLPQSDDEEDVWAGNSQSSLRKGISQEDDAVVFEKTFGGRPEFREPRNFKRWTSVGRRGCFFWEELGHQGRAIVSNSYNFTIPSSTNVIISMKPLEGIKHLDFRTPIDMGFVIMRGDQVVTLSEQGNVEGMVFARADLQRGSYRIYTFTSGAKMKPRQGSTITKAKLLKKSADGKLALTTNFKEALTDIFHMVDLDGNGYLSKSEFSYYTLRTSNEVLDDDLWEVVEEHCTLVNGEISLEDFMALNLREAEADSGDTENLWITLNTMGFNHELMIDETYPFLMEAFAEEAREVVLNVSPMDVKNTERVQDAILDYTLSKGERREIPGTKDCSVIVLLTGGRALVGVDNRTLDSRDLKKPGIWVKVDCERSRNLVAATGGLRKEICIRPGKAEIAIHGIPENPAIAIAFNGRIERK